MRAGRDLVVVGQFDRSEALCAPTEEQAALALGAEFSDPLRMPAWGDEVARALESQQIDRVRRGSPVLRPRTSRTRDPATLSPIRVSTATARLNTCVVNQPGRW
jgi:hypothetical protein